MIVKISAKNSSNQTKRALAKLFKSRSKNKRKLSDFYGKMPGTYGNGLDYQKKIRNEWA